MQSDPIASGSSDYAERWRQYRKFRNLGWLLLACYFPILIVIGMFASSIHADWLFYASWVIWVILSAILGHRIAWWRCPRCGKLFAGYWRGSFAKKCVHCGLPKFAPNPNDLAAKRHTNMSEKMRTKKNAKRARPGCKLNASARALLAIGRRCAADLRRPAVDHATLLYDNLGIQRGPSPDKQIPLNQ